MCEVYTRRYPGAKPHLNLHRPGRLLVNQHRHHQHTELTVQVSPVLEIRVSEAVLAFQKRFFFFLFLIVHKIILHPAEEPKYVVKATSELILQDRDSFADAGLWPTIIRADATRIATSLSPCSPGGFGEAAHEVVSCEVGIT